MTKEEAAHSQQWQGMDGATAWHLIDRHADDWCDVGLMMQAWFDANCERLQHNLQVTEQTKDSYAELAAAKAEISEYICDEMTLPEAICNLVSAYKDRNLAASKYCSQLNEQEAEFEKQLAARDLVIKQKNMALDHMDTYCEIRTSKIFPEQNKDWGAFIMEAIALQPTQEALDEFVQRAVEQEREACAQRAEAYAYMSENFNALAEEIRGRGK